MRVSAQCQCDALQPGFEIRAGTSTAHRAFEAQPEGHLFELFAVFMGAVVHGMNEFMHQGVEHIHGLAECQRDKYLVAGVLTALGAPALADMPAAPPGAAKVAQDLALGDDMVLDSEHRAHVTDRRIGATDVRRNGATNSS